MAIFNFNSSADQKDHMKRYFFWITLVLELFICLLLALLVYAFFTPKYHLSIYGFLGLGLILVWIGILIVYYSWAIYFYGVNMGLTDQDWNDIKDKRDTGAPLPEPDINPNSEQTMGLPSGTIRATLAVTLLVGGLALGIISLDQKSILKDNEVLIDNYSFFKTAFLMMIAFYFGNKALEYLLPNATDKKKPDSPEASSQNPSPGNPGDSAAGLNPVAPAISNPNNPVSDEPAKG